MGYDRDMQGVLLAVAIMVLPVAEGHPYRVERAGKAAGTATIELRLLSAGGKLTLVMIAFGPPGKPDTRVRQESVYDAKGAPVRLLQEVVGSDGRVRRRAVATFDEQGALLVVTEDGKATEKRVPLVRGAPRANAAEFWFLRDRPELGARETAFRFDLNEERWRLVEHVYRGQETVRVGGRATTLHRVDSEAGAAWLDDSGQPVIVQMGSVRMERTGP
jgi:hypothetical protein